MNREKKMVALMNATVSHEMRNPIHSILCQNINQAQLIEKLKELIFDKKIMKLNIFKEHLYKIFEMFHDSS